MFGRSNGVDWLVVGLGNPGARYEKTRHNAGFVTVDLWAEEKKVALNKIKFKGAYNILECAGQKVMVLKPQTYMNLSGEAVSAAANFYKIPPERILVIYDDVSLPVGKLRLREKGSAGGHNGIKSIIAHLGGDVFPRIKIGVGGPTDSDMVDWVIGVPSQGERKALLEQYQRAAKAAQCIVEEGFSKAMNQFNG